LSAISGQNGLSVFASKQCGFTGIFVSLWGLKLAIPAGLISYYDKNGNMKPPRPNPPIIMPDKMPSLPGKYYHATDTAVIYVAPTTSPKLTV